MSLPRTLVLALAVATPPLVGGCRAHPEQVMRPTFRGGGVVASDYETDLSIGGASADVETDVTSFEIGGGVTFFEPTDDILMRKVSRAEFSIAASEYELDDFGLQFDVDAIDIAAGGRYFFPMSATIQPFVSGHGVVTFFDDVDGEDIGTQLGLRAGAGVEFAITDRFFIDLLVDYTIPLLEAESDFDPTIGDEVETGVSGWAVRIGAGFFL